jgi:hypothetical protein
MKNISKMILNEVLDPLKTIIAQGRFQDLHFGAPPEFLGGIFAGLGRFWTPFWARLGPRGGSKIRDFGLKYETI